MATNEAELNIREQITRIDRAIAEVSGLSRSPSNRTGEMFLGSQVGDPPRKRRVSQKPGKGSA